MQMQMQMYNGFTATLDIYYMQYLTAVCLNNAVMSFSAVVGLLNIVYSLDDEAYAICNFTN